MDFPSIDQVVADLPYGNFVALRGAEHRNLLLRPRNGEENQQDDSTIKNLHAELYRCLSLGIWKEDKWDCSDTEIQESVINTIKDFLEYFTKRTLNHFLIKNSVVEIVKVLESILDCQSESLLMNSLKAVEKMVTNLPGSAPHFNQALDLLRPLIKLLASHQTKVVILSAVTSNIILSKLLPGQEKKVLEVLQKSKATVYLVKNVQRYPDREISPEYFQKNISVLGNILWRWPCFRFSVWNNADFLLILGDMISEDFHDDLKVSILQLYSSIALCKHGAEKILGEALLENMLRYMDKPDSHIVCINAFKLAQCLATTKRGCAEMMRICDKRLTNVITKAIDHWSSEKKDKPKLRISLLKEACRLAAIMRCTNFWGEEMRKLIEMVLDENHKTKVLEQKELPMDELISIVRKDFSSDRLPSVRPYVWDIIGGLATDCAEFEGDEFLLKVLIICASLCFTKSVAVARLNSNTRLMYEGEAASTAMFRLMYSPCHYVATESRTILGLVTAAREFHIDFLLRTLVDYRLAEAQVSDVQVLMSLVSLTCSNILQECRQLFVDFNGVKIILGFIIWLIENPIRKKRGRMLPRLYDERSCCSSLQEWEGEDVLLVYSLWILAEFLTLWANEEIDPLDNQVDFIETVLIQKIKDIFKGRFSQGSRWCSSYVLSSERIEQYRHRKKHSHDMKILARTPELEAQGMPKWGTPVPIFDPIAALRSAGHQIVDVRLESSTSELIDWKCDNCSSSVPHLHVPKVLLESSCEFWRALFRNWKDSQPYIIKVPLEWESLKIFGSWLYTDELPKPELDCLWENNLDLKNKETVVRGYIEIYDFADYRCTKELLELCHDTICCFLKSSRELSVTVIKLAADYFQSKLVQVVAQDMAPLYHHLRDSEELKGYDDVLEIIRLASVRTHLLQTCPKTR